MCECQDPFLRASSFSLLAVAAPPPVDRGGLTPGAVDDVVVGVVGREPPPPPVLTVGGSARESRCGCGLIGFVSDRRAGRGGSVRPDRPGARAAADDDAGRLKLLPVDGLLAGVGFGDEGRLGFVWLGLIWLGLGARLGLTPLPAAAATGDKLFF